MFDQRQEDESLELAIKLWQNPFLGCVLSAPAEIPFFSRRFLVFQHERSFTVPGRFS